MSDKEREEETSGFKVEDRRKFTAEGDPILSGPEASRAGQKSASAQPRPEEGRQSDTAREPAIDFASFIMSLAASGMAYLGEMPDPETGERMENLQGAQQMIDILTMLEKKTEGNLDPDEAQLLEGLLYELRMKYLTKRNLIKL